MTCTLHLKENMRHFLEKQGVALKDREAINRIVFDDFVSDPTSSQIDAITRNLREQSKTIPCGEIAMKYFTDHIRPLLFEQSQSACGESNLGDWTNNKCESMNHILKLITKWTASKLPNLIESLYEYVQQQITDLQRAIYHEGDIVLTAANAKLAITKCSYIALSEPES